MCRSGCASRALLSRGSGDTTSPRGVSPRKPIHESTKPRKRRHKHSPSHAAGEGLGEGAIRFPPRIGSNNDSALPLHLCSKRLPALRDSDQGGSPRRTTPGVRPDQTFTLKECRISPPHTTACSAHDCSSYSSHQRRTKSTAAIVR